jgi:hypothetical protein
MYVNVSAVAITAGLILAFFVVFGAVALNTWKNAERGVEKEREEKHAAILQRRKMTEAASRLETIRERAIREARSGFEMDVKDHRPLTLDEMYEHLSDIPSPSDHDRNMLNVAVTQQELYGRVSPFHQSFALQTLRLTRMRFAIRKPQYDPRAFPGGMPGPYKDAVPVGTEGAAAYNEESVWVFDGRVIVSGLNSVPLALRTSAHQFGPRLRPILRGYYGEHLDAFDDREIERAVIEGFERAMMERRYFRASH